MKFLGVILGESISWKDHIRTVKNKIAKSIGLLYWAKQLLILSSLKDTPKALDDFKNKQKSVWNHVLVKVEVTIFWKCTQYTIHWDKTPMLKKSPVDKINGAKNAVFFLLQTSTHHSFTFHLRFLYELKHKVRLSKTVCGIFHIWFHFVFIKVYIFVEQNAWTLWLWNIIIL